MEFSFEPDALFKSIQARFEDSEKRSSGAISRGGNASSFKSNKLRSSLFDTVSGAMQPEQKYVDRYRDLIKSSYIANARKELDISKRGYVTRTDRPTYQGVGWALGNKPGGLYKEFDADVFIDIVKPKSGTLEIKFETVANFDKTPWGEGLAKSRNPEIVSRNNILGWIWQKQKRGYFRIGAKKMSNIRQNNSSSNIKSKIASTINGIAIAIQRKMAKSPRPPVLKDWYRLDKNKRLELNFRKDVDKKGAYYRTQIRRSIIRKINAQS